MGGLLVAVVVVFSVATGGMRSITFVQAFQYWLKLTALAVPVVFLLMAWQADGSPTPGDGPATFPERTTVQVTEVTEVVVRDPVRVRVDGVIGTVGTSPRRRRTTEQPVTLRTGHLAGRRRHRR